MITITNNNIYCGEFSILNLSSLDKIEKIYPEEIINFLSDDVELGESVTFKRIFDIVACNVEKFNEIFYSSLGGHKLEPFLQEIENIPTETIESEYLEINWFCDKYEGDLNIYPSIHGISTKTNDVYALDFVSLNNIKNHIVKINKSVELFDYSKIKEISKADKVAKLDLGNKSFNVFDMFNAIFYEISFHGGPQDKKEIFVDLEDSIEEAQEELKLMENSITFEDMLNKLDADDKYLVKYKELRDRVEENRISIKKNLSKLKNCLIEKLKVYDIIQTSKKGDLKPFYKKLTDIEYNMQLLYGEEEDIKYHKFWLTPKCTCPKIDNLEIYPSKKPIFNDNCPIHGKEIKKTRTKKVKK